MGLFDMIRNKNKHTEPEEKKSTLGDLDPVYDMLKKEISTLEYMDLPKVQYELGVTYAEALTLRDQLIKDLYIFPEADGFKFKVNTCAFNTRSMNYEQAVYHKAVLSIGEENALGEFLGNKPATDANLRVYEKLIDEGLVLKVGDMLTLGYDRDSISFMTSLNMSDEDWFEEKCIEEAVNAVVNGGADETVIPFLSIIPTEVKDGFEARVSACRKEARSALPIRRDVTCDRIKYRFIECFLHNNYEDKSEDYHEIARRECEMLESAGFSGTLLYDTVKLCADEIQTLSDSSIKDLKKLFD